MQSGIFICPRCNQDSEKKHNSRHCIACWRVLEAEKSKRWRAKGKEPAAETGGAWDISIASKYQTMKLREHA